MLENAYLGMRKNKEMKSKRMTPLSLENYSYLNVTDEQKNYKCLILRDPLVVRILNDVD